MQKLHSILIDSGKQPLKVLENYLVNYPAISLDKKFEEIEHAQMYCRQHTVDMVICNIETVAKESIDIIKALQPATMIVCAGHREIIEQKSFEENIFGYLYQPFSYERILSLVAKANAFIAYTGNDTGIFRKNYVFIKSDYKTIRVDLDDVLYCEGLRDYTQIYLKNKSKPLITLQNLKSIIDKLPLRHFIRVHRSFIVSMEKIDSISRNEILIGNSEIPIGDAYRDKLYELIGSN